MATNSQSPTPRALVRFVTLGRCAVYHFHICPSFSPCFLYTIYYSRPFQSRSVLSTGAVLVDLPGVRDSNAARAKVAENYLQNCNQIAIVAPIKRAVDDGTAKELLGEQFKRRLLMDGNYGNVFFICTQTDDIEATETMRDHADVAQNVEGRYEKMTE